MEKEKEYINNLLMALQETIFNPDSDFHIDMKEADASLFFHTLANTVPNLVYQELTGNELNNLQFNHLANQLCFQNSKT